MKKLNIIETIQHQRARVILKSAYLMNPDTDDEDAVKALADILTSSLGKQDRMSMYSNDFRDLLVKIVQVVKAGYDV